ncbi:PREDICTED: limbin [Chrysochloris asiatica]|uniref:Limbin n=1 Tax=Chrysochloris asiatica TaxID=185453 RepID=A0A9B0WZB3_CHRAS|nr:PREDICTED: limbin [Chrysochloris asiatica]
MGPAGAPWVLAGGLLAATLALPTGAVSLRRPLGAQPSPEILEAPGASAGLGVPPGLNGARPDRTEQDLSHMPWQDGKSTLFNDVAYCGRRLQQPPSASVHRTELRNTEDFNLLLTSSASSSPWADSVLAFMPSWAKKTLFKSESPIAHRQDEHIPRELQGISESRVVFQKCAVVSGQRHSQSALVWLLVNTTRSPVATNLSDLLLLDNITGLTVRESAGNRTSKGFQAFRKKFLQAGDAFAVSYTAQLTAGDVRDGEILLLPAQLTFQGASQNRTQLTALFSITAEEKLTVLPNHGLHAAGFFIAFMVTLVLTWTMLFFLVRYQCLKGNMFRRHRVQHHDNKLEHSQFILADGVNEDLALSDQMVDILSSEDPGTMLEGLEDLEIATLNQADSDLEACRTQISKDIIALLLRSLTSRGHLSPQAERRMGMVFKQEFLLLENEIQEEYDRKMVALTAECDLETQKKTESQYQREMAAMEEAEELLKRVSERAAAECSSLLRTLHSLEQEHLQRTLALRQEEDLAKAHRQLAVFQRCELHRLFFTQIKGALLKGDLKPEAAHMLLQAYADIQGNVEELMDFFQATKRYHLSKRFGHRKYLAQNMQSSHARAQGLLNTAATQLTRLIQKHERAGYLDEDQMEMLLERAQTEVFSVKQKLDNELKQEKKKLRQKLVTKRRREMMQKHKEQQREQLSIGEAFRAAEDASKYLGQWRSVMADHSAALEELQERLDQAALDDLRALTLSLSEKATEELRRLQNSAMTQELLKRSVPWLFLQQILEEHGKELAARAEQLESEERGRGQEGVQGMRQRLKEEVLEASLEEQVELRRWEQSIYLKLCSAAGSLSQEELLGMKKEAQGSFTQLDQNLALPRIRARVLLQQCQSTWREAESLKLDQALAAPELQPQPKGRKQRVKGRSKADLLKKCLEDKIHILEQQGPECLTEKVRAELLRERVQQLDSQKQSFAESVVSLQFQKAAKSTKTLSAYTALLSIQELLLDELSKSETLTKSACAQILGSHTPELLELERKLEERLVQQDAVQQQQGLTSQQRWSAEELGLPNTPAEVGAEGQVSAVLQWALSKARKILENHQQSLRQEEQNCVVLEDLLENMETETFMTLYGQELRLASYLVKLAMVPGATLRRLLSVVQPAASQPELLSALDAVSEKHADYMVTAENDSSGEQGELGRRRDHQGWWRAFESRLRGDLVSQGRQKALWAHRRKERILKKTCLPLTERLVFPGKGSWPHLSLEPLGELAPLNIIGAETIDLLNTGEKLFIFRSPKEPEISLHVPPRRKKNFLNAKKASWASGMD